MLLTVQDVFMLGLLLYQAFAGVSLLQVWEDGGGAQAVLEADEGEVPLSWRGVKVPDHG